MAYQKKKKGKKKKNPKPRHHTLKAFLFVCMGHACKLGQETSLERISVQVCASSAGFA